MSFPSTISSSTTSSGSARPSPIWLEMIVSSMFSVSSPVRLSNFGSIFVAFSTAGGSVMFSASDVNPSPKFSDSSLTDLVSRTCKFSPASTSRPSPTCLSRSFPRLPPVRQGRVNRTYTANKLPHDEGSRYKAL